MVKEFTKDSALSADIVKEVEQKASELVKLFSETNPNDPMDAIAVSAVVSFLDHFAKDVIASDGKSGSVIKCIRSAALKMRDDFSGE